MTWPSLDGTRCGSRATDVGAPTGTRVAPRFSVDAQRSVQLGLVDDDQVDRPAEHRAQLVARAHVGRVGDADEQAPVVEEADRNRVAAPGVPRVEQVDGLRVERPRPGRGTPCRTARPAPVRSRPTRPSPTGRGARRGGGPSPAGPSARARAARSRSVLHGRAGRPGAASQAFRQGASLAHRPMGSEAVAH